MGEAAAAAAAASVAVLAAPAPRLLPSDSLSASPPATLKPLPHLSMPPPPQPQKKRQPLTLALLEKELRAHRTKEVMLLLKQALTLLDRHSFDADSSTFAALLKGCGEAQCLPAGMFVHQHIVWTDQEMSTFLSNCLIEMYGKCGQLDEARSVFDSLDRPNVFSCTIMIAAYAQNGLDHNAHELFQQMRLSGVKPNKFTFTTVLSTCRSFAALEQGISIHADAVQDGFVSDAVVGTALVNMYGNCGTSEDASLVFERIQEHDVVSWNAMIAVCVQHGHGREALQLFFQMEQEGVQADKITFVSILGACNSAAKGKVIHSRAIERGFAYHVVVENALIDMYGKCGNVNAAWFVFKKMRFRDVVSWTSIIIAYSQQGYCKEAIQLYKKMQLAGLKPNDYTFVSVLSACANLAAIEQGRELHNTIIQCGLGSDVVVGTALVNMYGKCGKVADARWVFDYLPGRDAISWKAIVAVYLQNGLDKEALDLCEQMNQENKKVADIMR